jgi:hypothetical protein
LNATYTIEEIRFIAKIYELFDVISPYIKTTMNTDSVRVCETALAQGNVLTALFADAINRNM